ncbi:MAG: ABC transporter ATP-binding protein [Flavobacteriia bacterium]|nr:ABC transporter ATP-binding protein [Flavobacteriia bacterium]
MIEIKQVKIGYKKCLFSIEEIHLERGKVYSLIGANGAGKTTFLQTIQGNIPAIQGLIKVDDKNILEIDRYTKSTLIAFVNSKFDGIEYLKVKDYVGLGRIPYTNALGRLSLLDMEIVNKSIHQLNIEKLADLNTTELSDGERQLTAIARAICQETAIIILDEPTAFLDYANRKIVMEEMKKIASSLNLCIIISTHDLELCLESETEILIINKSTKKMQVFPKNQLLKSELVEIGF